MDVLVIHNPWAGPSSAAGAVLQAVHWWRTHGWRVDLAETHAPGDATMLSRRAAGQGLGAVIVAGGDGTLSQAASGLAGSQTALGLLPVGTANIWARDVGLPILTGRGVKAAAEAARMLAQGAVREIDLGRVGDRHFMLWLGLGLDGHIVSHVEPRTRLAKSFGVPYYFLAAVWAARRWQGARQRVVIDGEVIEGQAYLTLVGNARRYGGGIFDVSPGAVLDDGLFEALIFEGRTFADSVTGAWRLYRGGHRSHPGVTIRAARRIAVSSPDSLPVEIDGDPLRAGPPLTITVAARALRVLVPAQAPVQLFSKPALVAPGDML